MSDAHAQYDIKLIMMACGSIKLKARWNDKVPCHLYLSLESQLVQQQFRSHTLINDIIRATMTLWSSMVTFNFYFFIVVVIFLIISLIITSN